MAGVRSATTAGDCEMRMLSVVSWASMVQGLPLMGRGMVRDEGLFFWMMWDAMDQRPTCGVVPVVVGHPTIVTIEKTPAPNVINFLVNLDKGQRLLGLK